ncbi:MAG: protein-glutamate O-methyltransferase CheR [Alphaproteobacteria bacterium]|nr:protein-glutamate O-methyltransferase CheR [Alphaproteobacteria bacterium]
MQNISLFSTHDDNEEPMLESIEIKLILNLVKDLHGYDFTHYSKESIKRILQEITKKRKLAYISDLIPLLLRQPAFLNDFLAKMSITVTKLFRDPEFFASYRQHIIPYLSTFPYIKAWHAGCATGQEVYSHAIMLHEENLLDRALLYGTDFNNKALDTASAGIYSTSELMEAEAFYREAGGQNRLSDYYHSSHNFSKIEDYLKKPITFSHHNLTNDRVFGEMNVIFCRNTLIYFDRKEDFETVDEKNRIFRKKFI